MGAHPVTIGTSHALESIISGPRQPYDQDRKVTTINAKPYDEYWINIFTLVRNIVQSIPGKDQLSLNYEAVCQVLKREIEYIRSAITPTLPVVFYYCQYNDVDKKHKYALFKQDNTPRSKAITNAMIGAIALCIKEDKEIKVYPNNIEVEHSKSIIITTSHAYDLLFAAEFNDAALLESNTGVLKNKPMWYTKLSMGNKNPRLPFNYVTLQLYGDSQLFRPMDKKLRDAVDSISERFEWTYATTIDRMRYTLSRLDYVVKAPIFDLF